MLRPLGEQDHEDLDRLLVSADAGCLQLTSLLLDSELYMSAAIVIWTASVTRRPYAFGLDPHSWTFPLVDTDSNP
jgi:hypothetical protein